MLLLRDLMLELKVFIDYYKLKRKQEMRAKSTRFKLSNSAAVGQPIIPRIGEDPMVKHILKRFTTLGSSSLKSTIQKCEALGELQN